MKLTQEEVQQKSQEKAQAIQTLCKQLEVVVSAEQMINPQGFIKQIVYYTDTEKYDIIEEAQLPLPGVEDKSTNDKPNEDEKPSEEAPKAPDAA